MRDLGFEGLGTGINDAGQVVGLAYSTTGKERAFLWDGSRMFNLGTLGGTSSAAFAINRAGRIVGESRATSGAVHATLWQPNR